VNLVVAAAFVWSLVTALELGEWTTSGILLVVAAGVVAAVRNVRRSGDTLLTRLRRHGDAVRSASDASLVRPTHRTPHDDGDGVAAEGLDRSRTDTSGSMSKRDDDIADR
jgi:hypothetical protein